MTLFDRLKVNLFLAGALISMMRQALIDCFPSPSKISDIVQLDYKILMESEVGPIAKKSFIILQKDISIMKLAR